MKQLVHNKKKEFGVFIKLVEFSLLFIVEDKLQGQFFFFFFSIGCLSLARFFTPYANI